MTPKIFYIIDFGTPKTFLEDPPLTMFKKLLFSLVFSLLWLGFLVLCLGFFPLYYFHYLVVFFHHLLHDHHCWHPTCLHGTHRSSTTLLSLYSFLHIFNAFKNYKMVYLVYFLLMIIFVYMNFKGWWTKHWLILEDEES